MRVLEICIYIALILNLILDIKYKKRVKNHKKYIAFLPVVLVVFHVVLEGYRWQMTITYLACLLIAFGQLRKSLKTKPHIKKPGKLWYIGKILTICILILSISLPLLLPVVDLPKPSGAYKVGTSRIYLKDEGRLEELSPEQGDYRELMINVWYPSDQESGTLKSYWTKEDIKNRAYEDFMLEGNFWYEYLSLSKTNSYIETPLSTKLDKYPVIIYSQSYKSLDSEYTILCEELASQGYIVMSLSHTYESSASIFPNGRIVKGDTSVLESKYEYNPEEEYLAYEELLVNIANAESDEEIVEYAKTYISNEDINLELMKIREGDISFVIDELSNINESDAILKGGIDIEHIGCMGWSFGGAASIQTSSRDDRIDVVVNMDGAPYGDHYINDSPKSTPTLILTNEDNPEDITITSRVIWDALGETYSSEYKVLEIPDIIHTNFNDYPTQFAVMKNFGYWGPLKPEKLMDIHREETIRFLDRYLKEKE